MENWSQINYDTVEKKLWPKLYHVKTLQGLLTDDILTLDQW